MAASPPHAILLAGPPSVGKTTLARDLAALLLCDAAPPDRPCHDCRACRRIDSGNHPDVHVLAPAGPADRIGLGGDPRSPGIRDLIATLALRPVEGRVRIAIVERAHRLSEDAQHALLKTLEEPPPDTCIVLCADEEEALLETVRSRCARVRLGSVETRRIEELLEAHGAADRPTAARLARIVRGRPGEALRLASSPDVVVARAEIARLLIDLSAVGRSIRLARAREALTRAVEIVGGGDPPDADVDGAGARRSPAARRRGAQWLVAIWRDVAYDIALGQLGGSSPREPDLLEETRAVGAMVPAGSMTAFLSRLDEAARRLDASASPELALDVLALTWPSRDG
jgi:DNA polymerase-3 subunit delta'